MHVLDITLTKFVIDGGFAIVLFVLFVGGRTGGDFNSHGVSPQTLLV